MQGVLQWEHEPNRPKISPGPWPSAFTPATTHAEALRELRTAFPESSLALRVAALAMLNRRGADDSSHIPR